MSVPNNDVNLAQWAMGGLLGLLSIMLGWIWQRQGSVEARLDQRISEGIKAVKDAGSSDARDLWQAITEDRRQATEHRERVIEKIAAAPTKDDLAAMEARLMKALDRRV